MSNFHLAMFSLRVLSGHPPLHARSNPCMSVGERTARWMILPNAPPRLVAEANIGGAEALRRSAPDDCVAPVRLWRGRLGNPVPIALAQQVWIGRLPFTPETRQVPIAPRGRIRASHSNAWWRRRCGMPLTGHDLSTVSFI